MIWRGIEGKDQEERRGLVEGIMEREIRKVAGMENRGKERGDGDMGDNNGDGGVGRQGGYTTEGMGGKKEKGNG